MSVILPEKGDCKCKEIWNEVMCLRAKQETSFLAETPAAKMLSVQTVCSVEALTIICFLPICQTSLYCQHKDLDHHSPQLTGLCFDESWAQVSSEFSCLNVLKNKNFKCNEQKQTDNELIN